MPRPARSPMLSVGLLVLAVVMLVPFTAAVADAGQGDPSIVRVRPESIDSGDSSPFLVLAHGTHFRTRARGQWTSITYDPVANVTRFESDRNIPAPHRLEGLRFFPDVCQDHLLVIEEATGDAISVSGDVRGAASVGATYRVGTNVFIERNGIRLRTTFFNTGRVALVGVMEAVTVDGQNAPGGAYDVRVKTPDVDGEIEEVTAPAAIQVIGGNLAPVVDPVADQTVAEGQSLSLTVTATDPDGDDALIRYTSDSLPSGATLDAVSGVLTWIPTFDQSGIFAVTVTATDGDGVTGTAAFGITVTDVNRPPVLDPVGPIVINEGDVLVVPLAAVDPDAGQTLTYSIVSPLPPAFASIPDPAVGQLRLAPGFFAAGIYQFEIGVTDNGSPALSATTVVDVEVRNVNRSPVLDPVVDRTVAEGETLVVQLSASDPDGDLLSYRIDSGPVGAVVVGSEFRWTPGFDQAGLHTVTVVVEDNGFPSESDSTSFTVTVTNVNRAPVLAPVGDRSVSEGSPLSVSVAASDPDTGDSLTLSASGLPTGATFDALTGEFSWVPGFDQAGVYPVTFEVVDNGGLNDSETITIEVLDVNRAPVLAPIGDQVVNEGSRIEFTVAATDPDGHAVRYSAVDLPAGATLDPDSGLFIWTTGFDQAGQYPITILATDNGTPPLTAEETITITVHAVNAPPVILPVDTLQLVRAGETLTFPVPATDPDGDSLTWTGESLPVWVTVDPLTGDVTADPPAGTSGQFGITIRVTDEGVPARSAAVDITIRVLSMELALYSGNGQTTINHRLFPVHLRVFVGAGNDPVAGIPLEFTVISGDGRFTGNDSATEAVITGPDGVAEASLLRAGSALGLLQVEVRPADGSAQFGDPVVFALTVTPAGPARAEVDFPDGPPTAGVPGRVRFTLKDASGQPVQDPPTVPMEFDVDGVQITGADSVVFDGTTEVMLDDVTFHAAGDQQVRVVPLTAPAFQTTTRTINVAAGSAAAICATQGLSHNVPAGGIANTSIGGAVTDQSGNPKPFETVDATIAADSDGYFQDPGVPDPQMGNLGKAIQVIAGPNGHFQLPPIGHLQGGNRNPIRVALRAGANGGGSPLAEVIVQPVDLPVPGPWAVGWGTVTISSAELIWRNQIDYDSIRIKDGDTGQVIVTLPGNATSHDVTGLGPNARVSLQVCGVLDGDVSPAAASTCFTLPPQAGPENVVVRRVYPGVVELQVVGYDNLTNGSGTVCVRRGTTPDLADAGPAAYVTAELITFRVNPAEEVYAEIAFRNGDGVQSEPFVLGPIQTTSAYAGLESLVNTGQLLGLGQTSDPLAFALIDGNGERVATAGVPYTVTIVDGLGVVGRFAGVQGGTFAGITSDDGSGAGPGIEALGAGRATVDITATVEGQTVMLRYVIRVVAGATRLDVTTAGPFSVRVGDVPLTGIGIVALDVADQPVTAARIQLSADGQAVQFVSGNPGVVSATEAILETDGNGEIEIPALEGIKVGGGWVVARLLDDANRLVAEAIVNVDVDYQSPPGINDVQVELDLDTDNQRVNGREVPNPFTGKVEFGGRAGLLRMTVTRASTGEPIPGAVVRFHPVDADQPGGEPVARFPYRLLDVPLARDDDQLVTIPDGFNVNGTRESIAGAQIVQLSQERLAIIGNSKVYILHLNDCAFGAAHALTIGGPIPVAGHSAVNIGNDRVLCMGGYTAANEPAPTRIYHLDPTGPFEAEEVPGWNIARRDATAFRWGDEWVGVVGGQTVETDGGGALVDGAPTNELLFVQTGLRGSIPFNVPLPGVHRLRSSVVHDSDSTIWVVGSSASLPAGDLSDLGQVLQIDPRQMSVGGLPPIVSGPFDYSAVLDNIVRGGVGADASAVLTAGPGGVRVINLRTGAELDRPADAGALPEPGINPADPDYSVAPHDPRASTFQPADPRFAVVDGPDGTSRLVAVGSDRAIIYSLGGGRQIDMQFKVVLSQSPATDGGVALAPLHPCNDVGDFILIGGFINGQGPTDGLQVFASPRCWMTGGDVGLFHGVADSDGVVECPGPWLTGAIGEHSIGYQVFVDGETVSDIGGRFVLYLTCNGRAVPAPTFPGKDIPFTPFDEGEGGGGNNGGGGRKIVCRPIPECVCQKDGEQVCYPYEIVSPTLWDAADLEVEMPGGGVMGFVPWLTTGQSPSAPPSSSHVLPFEVYDLRESVRIAYPGLNDTDVARKVFYLMASGVVPNWPDASARISATATAFPDGTAALDLLVLPAFQTTPGTVHVDSASPGSADFVHPIDPETGFGTENRIYVTATSRCEQKTNGDDAVHPLPIDFAFGVELRDGDAARPGGEIPLIRPAEAVPHKIKTVALTASDPDCVFIDQSIPQVPDADPDPDDTPRAVSGDPCLGRIDFCNNGTCPATVKIVPVPRVRLVGAFPPSVEAGGGQIAFLADPDARIRPGTVHTCLGTMEPLVFQIGACAAKTVEFKGVSPSTFKDDVLLLIFVNGRLCLTRTTYVIGIKVEVCEDGPADNVVAVWHESGRDSRADCQKPARLEITLDGPPECKVPTRITLKQAADGGQVVMGPEVPCDEFDGTIAGRPTCGNGCKTVPGAGSLKIQEPCLQVGQTHCFPLWGLRSSVCKGDIEILVTPLQCECADALVESDSSKYVFGPAGGSGQALCEFADLSDLCVDPNGGDDGVDLDDPAAGAAVAVITGPVLKIAENWHARVPVTVVGLELSLCHPGPKGIWCGEHDSDDESCGDKQRDDTTCPGHGLPVHIYFEAPADCVNVPITAGGGGLDAPIQLQLSGSRGPSSRSGGVFLPFAGTTGSTLGLDREITVSATIGGKTLELDCEDYDVQVWRINLICKGIGELEYFCAREDFKVSIIPSLGRSGLMTVCYQIGDGEPIRREVEIGNGPFDASENRRGVGQPPAGGAFFAPSGAVRDRRISISPPCPGVDCRVDFCAEQRFTMVGVYVEADGKCANTFPVRFKAEPAGVPDLPVRIELANGGGPLAPSEFTVTPTGAFEPDESVTNTAEEWWGTHTLVAEFRLPGPEGIGCTCVAQVNVTLIDFQFDEELVNRDPLFVWAKERTTLGFVRPPDAAGTPLVNGVPIDQGNPWGLEIDPLTGAISIRPDFFTDEPVVLRIEIPVGNGEPPKVIELVIHPVLRQGPMCNPCIKPHGVNPNHVAPSTSGHSGNDPQTVGDPVQLDRGDVSMTVSDLVIAGRGFPFAHVRSYRGFGDTDTPQGLKWDHGYNIRLIIEANGDVILMDGDRIRADVYPVDQGDFTTPASHFTRLTRDPGSGIYRLLQQDGMALFFDSFGRFIRKEDPNGNRMDVLYEDAIHPDRMTAVIDTMGRRIRYQYYPDDDPVAARAGRLQSVTDFIGRSVRYNYDSKGRLVSCKSPVIVGTSNGNDFPDGREETYSYIDDPGNEQRDSLLHEVVKPNENESRSGFGSSSGVPIGTPCVVYDYDDRGRCIRQQWGDSNQVITYAYELELLPATALRNATQYKTIVTDRNGNVTVYRFTGLGQMVEKRDLTRGVRSGADPAEFVSFWKYNGLNQLVLRTFPEGNSVEYSYDDGVVTVGNDTFVEPRLQSNLDEVIVHPGSRGGDQAQLVTRFVVEPIFNRTCVTIDPRAAATPAANPAEEQAANLRYAFRAYFDWEEADNRVALARFLVPDLDSTPNTGPGWLYVTALLDRMKQRGGSLGLAPTDNVPAVNIQVGTDLNGDGVTTRIAGNVVRTLAPKVNLLPEQANAMGAGSLEQYVSSATFYNRFGQPTGTVDAEGNINAIVYFPTANPSGGAGAGDEVERDDGSISGGYVARTIADQLSSTNDIVVARAVGASFIDQPLGAFSSPIARTTASPAEAITALMVHDLRGNPVRMTDPRGAVYRIEYNQADEVVSSTAPEPYGWSSRLFRDANGDVVVTEIDNVVVDLDEERRPQLVESAPFTNLRVRPGTPGAFVHRARYNILRNLVETDTDAVFNGQPRRLVTTYAYDRNQNLVLVTLPEGNQYATAYDERDLVWQSIAGANSLDESVTRSFVDLNGNVIRVRDPRGASSFIDYDGYDRAIRTVDRVGNEAFVTYDAVSNPLSSRFVGDRGDGTPVDLARGQTRYDELSRPIESITDLFDTAGNPIATGGPNADRPFVRFVSAYNGNSLVRASIHDNGGISTVSYDGVNRPTVSVDAIGNQQSVTYDKASNVVETVSLQVATDGVTVSETYTNRFEYDVLNRMVRAIDNLGNPVIIGFDSRGNRTVTADARGNTVEWIHDGANRLRHAIRLLRNGVGDGQIDVEYEYDDNSRMTLIRDDLGHPTVYTYDNQNRLKTTTFANNGVVTYTYDPNSNIVRHEDQNGTIINSTYDALDRVVSVGVDLPGNGSGVVTTENGTTRIIGTLAQSFHYDGLNRIVQATDFNEPNDASDDAVCTYAWDSLGRMLHENQFFEGVGFDVAYEWESVSRQTAVHYPNGNVLTREFDLLDRMTACNWTDAAGHNGVADMTCTYVGYRPLTRRVLDVVTRDYRDPDDATRSGYDGLGRPVFLNYGAGTLVYGYDEVSNETFESDSATLGTAGAARNLERYDYDNVYRVTGYTRGVRDADPTIPSVTTLSGDERRSGQQASPPMINGPPARERTWLLDGVGSWNQTTTDGIVAPNTTGDINQYTSFDGAILDHAPNGNTVVDAPTVRAHGLAYEYDAFNRLRRVFDPTTDETVGLYTYDAAGRRIAREADVDGDATLETSVRYLLDGARVIEERDRNDSHSLIREYVFGNYIDEPVWQADGIGTQHLHCQDENFNVYALLDSSGSLVESVRYDAYGGRQRYDEFGTELGSANSPTSLTVFGFQGRRHDSESGLVYFRARFLNPVTGRFTCFDSMGFVDSLGLFEFGRSAPAIHTDPNGKAVVTTLVLGTLLGAAIYAGVKAWFSPEERSFFNIVKNFTKGFVVTGTGMLVTLATGNPAAGYAAAMASMGLVSGVESAVDQYLTKEEIDLGEVVFDIVVGGLTFGIVDFTLLRRCRPSPRPRPQRPSAGERFGSVGELRRFADGHVDDLALGLSSDLGARMPSFGRQWQSWLGDADAMQRAIGDVSTDAQKNAYKKIFTEQVEGTLNAQRKINFDVTNFGTDLADDEVADAFKRALSGPAGDTMTVWEMKQIIDNPTWLSNTRFVSGTSELTGDARKAFVDRVRDAFRQAGSGN